MIQTTTIHDHHLLIDFVETYAVAKSLCQKKSIRGYRMAANSVGHFLGRPVKIVELTDALLGEWAKSLLENGFAVSNIEAMRRHVESLWRAARDAGLCEHAPEFKYHRGRAPHAKAQEALERHLLYNDLAKETQDYYRNKVGAFAAWAAGDPSRQAFDAQTVSEYIRDKQQTKVAPWTVKSSRHALKTLLLGIGDNGKIRKIKVPRLIVAVWREGDIAALIAAVPKAIFPLDDSMKALHRRHYWRTLITAAWHTGLSIADLIRVDRSHVDATGRVEIRRTKTDKRTVTWLPPELIDECTGGNGPFWKPQTGWEHFRTEFSRIVKAAGLVGTFKKLRKSSGTMADEMQPGRGHVHLGNTRRVFETHYQAADIRIEPVRLPVIGPAKGGGA